MIENCIKCNKCVKECEFLKKYGNPIEVQDKLEKDILISYECSLCGVCEVICPNNVKFVDFILSKRILAVKQGIAPLKSHKKILTFEKNASSNLLKIYKIPKNAKKIFFPGCAFSGNSPKFVIEVYKKLKKILNEPVGIVVDCCFKISHDIGLKDKFLEKTEEKIKFFKEKGIDEIITVCASCTDIFRKYLPFKVSTIFNYFNNEKIKKEIEKVNVHDPCALRNDESTHKIIREILKNSNIKVVKMPHEKETTFCCGEGGAAGFIDKIYAKSWKKKRLKEAKYPIIVYCYGCKYFLSNKTLKTYHILDLIFNNKKSVNTINFWINKFKLKLLLKRKI